MYSNSKTINQAASSAYYSKGHLTLKPEIFLKILLLCKLKMKVLADVSPAFSNWRPKTTRCHSGPRGAQYLYSEYTQFTAGTQNSLRNEEVNRVEEITASIHFHTVWCWLEHALEKIGDSWVKMSFQLKKVAFLPPLCVSCLKTILKYQGWKVDWARGREYVYLWVVRRVTWVTKIQTVPLGLVLELSSKRTDKSVSWEWSPKVTPPCRESQARGHPSPSPRTPAFLPAYSHSLGSTAPFPAPASWAACLVGHSPRICEMELQHTQVSSKPT